MSLLSLVIIGVLTMLCLAVALILFVVLYQRKVINHEQQLKELNRRKQEELIQAAIRSEEEERMRIAADLHDDVGATLSSIRLMLHQVARTQTPDSAVHTVQSLLDDTIQKVRNLSHQLQPGTLQYLGLTKALQSLSELLNRTGHIKVHFSAIDGWPPLPTESELALYRIVQELLNNILKHTTATQVHISTSIEQGAACIRILHDGPGLTEQMYQNMLYKKGAIGLKNIESRLKSVKASLSFPPTDHAGFASQMLLCLPIPQTVVTV